MGRPELCYNKDRILGKGKNGVVYEGKWNGAIVAVKRIELDKINPEYKIYVNFLKKLKHPNVIKLLYTKQSKRYK